MTATRPGRTLPRPTARERARSRAWLIAGAGSLGGVTLAILASMLFGGSNAPGSTRTAFASAPTGTYVVAVRADDAVDIIDAISVSDGTAYEVARVPHLPGYTSHAAVSPSGQWLALVVADGGTPGSPVASLQVIDIETGAILRAGEAIDQLQTPLWTPDGAGVVVTVTTVADPDTSAAATVAFWYAGLDGASRLLGEVRDVAGAYPVGYDPGGRLLAVAIDTRGSVLLRDFAEVTVLSNNVTRDWALSPDGTQLAFLEANLDDGLSYTGRVATITEPKGASSAVTADGMSATGVAWASAADEPEFGAAPLTAGRGGFTVPLDYSADDEFLVVQKWSGSSVANPGEMTIEVRGPEGSVSLDQYARFYGWARR